MSLHILHAYFILSEKGSETQHFLAFSFQFVVNRYKTGSGDFDRPRDLGGGTKRGFHPTHNWAHNLDNRDLDSSISLLSLLIIIIHW